MCIYIYTHMYTVSKNHCFTFIDNLYYLYLYSIQIPEEKGIQTSKKQLHPRLLQDLDGALHTECRGKGNKSQRPERAKYAKRWGLQSGPKTFGPKNCLVRVPDTQRMHMCLAEWFPKYGSWKWGTTGPTKNVLCIYQCAPGSVSGGIPM